MTVIKNSPSANYSAARYFAAEVAPERCTAATGNSGPTGLAKGYVMCLRSRGHSPSGLVGDSQPPVAGATGAGEASLPSARTEGAVRVGARLSNDHNYRFSAACSIST